MAIERTLVLLKSDAVERGLVGEIIKRFENVGLKIIAMKLVKPTRELAKKHYKVHVDKPFYPGLEQYLTSGPVIAMVLEGVNAIAVVRKLIGSTEPHKAQPGTIRGDFAHVTFSHADESGKAVKNLIHASDSVESAEYEISVWFDPQEIVEYELVHEKHTR